MLISRSNVKSGVIKKKIAGEIYSTIHSLYLKTEQYPELLSVKVLRAETGRQAEEEGNWMIWSTF